MHFKWVTSCSYLIASSDSKSKSF